MATSKLVTRPFPSQCRPPRGGHHAAAAAPLHPRPAPGPARGTQQVIHAPKKLRNAALAALTPAAVAAGAATAPAAAAVPAQAWWGWSGVALLVYVAYWALVLQRVLPRGRPVGDIMSSGRDKLFLAVAALELAVVFLLPWAASAAAGAWRQGLTYFGPIMVMTAVNIFLEAWHRRALYVLSVYSSTGANNLWRLCAYFAALWHMSTVPGGSPLAFQALAWVGAALSCAIILIFEPVAMRLIPVAPDKRH